jgi:hypothetical protein
VTIAQAMEVRDQSPTRAACPVAMVSFFVMMMSAYPNTRVLMLRETDGSGREEEGYFAESEGAKYRNNGLISN